MSISTFPDSPSGESTNKVTSPLSPTDPSSGNANGFPSLPTDIVPSSGVVRRKPARRANTAERRATHNAVERQRRETLNGRFLDLAALLPNLVSVRRPSKSAIVNSSIAIIHTQRRLRAIAGREIRQLAAEAEGLRREVNEWRASRPRTPNGANSLLEAPQRSADFQALMELEDLDEEEMRMGEEERVAYEMRGESAMFGDDGEGDELDDELSDAQQQQQQLHAAAQAQAKQQRMRSHSAAQPQHIANAPTHQNQRPYNPFQSQLHQQMAQHQGLPASYGSSYGSYDAPINSLGQVAGYPNPLPHPLIEADAAKLAAWNAHIYSALAQQQAQSLHHSQSPQQQWAASMQFQTPPNSSQGTPGLFGGGTPNQALLAHFQRASMVAASQSIFGSKHSRTGGGMGMANVDDDSQTDASGGASPQSQGIPNGGGSPHHSIASYGSYPGDAPISALSGSPPSAPGSLSGASTSSSGIPSLGSNSTAGSAPVAATAHLNLGGNDIDTFANAFPNFPPPSAGNRSPWATGGSSVSTPNGLTHAQSPISVGGGGGGINYPSMYMMF